ncbi:MAG: sigma-70 family RNA polymerase sigma factor [Paludibacteraceae bacterium]|nr:sigma-70 family RNA polymerase sigma factor [Paludibacteraceae bacterium]
MKQMSHFSDDELVKLYEQGNNEAFEHLLNRYKDRVFTQIFLLVHNKELAEDIFQDTFIKAIVFMKQGRYTDSGKFYPWLSRIAHNLIVDHYRRNCMEQALSSDTQEIDLFNAITLSEGSIEDVIVNEQVLEDVVKLVDYLPENQQEVVRMRFFEDLSFKEIAQATGVSINTALGRMRYALMNMRRLAQEYHILLES